MIKSVLRIKLEYASQNSFYHKLSIVARIDIRLAYDSTDNDKDNKEVFITLTMIFSPRIASDYILTKFLSSGAGSYFD